MSIIVDANRQFAVRVPVVIVGAGACGLIAALAAHDAGAQVLVIERDDRPSGSTALSSGFIPACNTRYQREHDVEDSVSLMREDILAKNHGEADALIVDAICATSGTVIEWLCDRHNLSFVLVDGFLYPGHRALRMHAVPERTGAALMAALLQAVTNAGIDVLTTARVDALIADQSSRILGVGYARPDGSRDEVGCDALILASSGFGGSTALVRQHMPEISEAMYFGHSGNRGDALIWGMELGAAVADLTSYQGHGSVATPQNILISWALMMEGGVQVNSRGVRFSNEHLGYSEQCLPVVRQPGRVAWCVYDERLHRLGLEFEDYRLAQAAGAIRSGIDTRELGKRAGVDSIGLAVTLQNIQEYAAGHLPDPFGRDFTAKPPLRAPFYAVKVTGALFHTQGGLMVDASARVLDSKGQVFPNLFAGGGAARGISGAHVWGYLSGNGLLTATTLGYRAGVSAARIINPHSIQR